MKSVELRQLQIIELIASSHCGCLGCHLYKMDYCRMWT